ncbi:MAG: fumarylacetoacetate hydrolase family protein [Actinobacteria bacterium]|nr:fumarylacetoacetate hydrolase family protein [Actinomycetota bacterium]
MAGDLEGYRLLSYGGENGPRAGVLTQGRVYPAADLLADTRFDGTSVLAILRDWPESHAALAAAAATVSADAGRPLAEVDLLAPILYPPTIYCAGANYWDHLEEMEGPKDRSERAEEPWFFVKTSAPSVVADGARIRIPDKIRQLDWEAELAVVIGRRAKEVAAEEAHAYIAGYTILNDLSARDLMRRDDRAEAMTYDWVGQKCFDGAAPMGPWLTPADYVPDVHDLGVKLWLDDVLKQNSHTSGLIHDVYEQVAWLSGQLTLLPGDVIGTGSPAGVGMPRGEFIGSGDTVRIEIECCGALTNSFI